jgi:adenine nucleotide transporter 17
MKMQGAKLRKEDEGLRKYPKYNGIFDGLYKISTTEGPATLWSGTLPSLVLVSNPALQFMFYESLKRRVQAFLGIQDLNSSLIFTMGAIAKSLSTVITYPLQVVQSKLRYGSDDVKGKNMIEIMVMIVQKNGVKNGLYKGMEVKLLQTVLTTALMFLCYEKIAAFVFRVMRGKAKTG